MSGSITELRQKPEENPSRKWDFFEVNCFPLNAYWLCYRLGPRLQFLWLQQSLYMLSGLYFEKRWVKIPFGQRTGEECRAALRGVAMSSPFVVFLVYWKRYCPVENVLFRQLTTWGLIMNIVWHTTKGAHSVTRANQYCMLPQSTDSKVSFFFIFQKTSLNQCLKTVDI